MCSRIMAALPIVNGPAKKVRQPAAVFKHLLGPREFCGSHSRSLRRQIALRFHRDLAPSRVNREVGPGAPEGMRPDKVDRRFALYDCSSLTAAESNDKRDRFGR